MDGGGVDVLVRVEIEVAEPFVLREIRGFDAADRGAPVPVVAFGQQQLGQEPLVCYVAFNSDAGNLVPGDTNSLADKPFLFTMTLGSITGTLLGGLLLGIVPSLVLIPLLVLLLLLSSVKVWNHD